jgi:hypothetical protein
MAYRLFCFNFQDHCRCRTSRWLPACEFFFQQHDIAGSLHKGVPDHIGMLHNKGKIVAVFLG